MTKLTKLIVGAVVFGGLFLNNTFAAMVNTNQFEDPIDPRYLSALKTAGINSFQQYPLRELANMSYTDVFDINNPYTPNQNSLTNRLPAARINHFYKNHMQIQLSAWGPHFRNWIFRYGWIDGVPHDALTDGDGNALSYGCLDTYDGIVKWVPELDTVQKYCDFMLENYTKPMIKARYEQGMYMFVIDQEDYWRMPRFQGNPQYTLDSFFPLHDYHEYDGLSLEEKEKRMREVVMMFYKKLYEWKNENYPKIILIHSLACAHTRGPDGTMLKGMRDIPWVDWFGMNGGTALHMVGAPPNAIEDEINYPGQGSPYPQFKQMIETNSFEYLNADGVMEDRLSRGWGIAQTESYCNSDAPGTPEEFLKLPEQYSNTRYYDYTINVPEPSHLSTYPKQCVFQKYMSEWSALDTGNNYIKLHTLSSFKAYTYPGAWLWHYVYPSTFIDGNFPAGARYFTDEHINPLLENHVQSGKIWIDNFDLIKDGVSVCQEGDFETIPSLVWDIRRIEGNIVTIVRSRPTYSLPVYTEVTSPPPDAFHAEGIGVGGSKGVLCNDGLEIASQVCGSGLGNTRLDFSIMAKGIATLSGNDPMLGIYWQSYDSSGNLLEEGKAFSDATPDGKFWYVPLTDEYQNFSGYILNNDPATDHVKISINNAFPLNKAPFFGLTAPWPSSIGAPLAAAAYCFNGPYGYDETTNQFTFWNKVTQSNETASTSKYMFLRDEMMTPGGNLYDVWGGTGTQWPLVIKKDGITYNPDTGKLSIVVRNVCGENSLSAPIHIFSRNKADGPPWDTSLYIKAKPENVYNSLILSDRIAYIDSSEYSVPGPTSSTEDPLTSYDNSLELTVDLPGSVVNGKMIYVYIEDTDDVKGWTAFNLASTNLVYNGDFEQGMTGWTPMQNNEVLELSSYGPLSGDSSLKVATPGIVVSEGVLSSVAYPVEKGKTYIASAYVRGNPSQQGTVKICLAGTQGGWTYASQVTELNYGWQKISVTRTITEDNETLYVTVLTPWVTPQAITFDVDRIELMEVKDYQMVYNGDFEQGTTGWTPMQNNEVLGLSSYAVSGDSSLKVTTPGIVLTEGVLSGVVYQVEKGKTYIASAYVRGDPSQQGKVKICFAGTQGGWTYADQVTELNTEWHKISVTRTITEDNETLYVTVLTWETPQAITFYVDRIELMEDKFVGCWKLDEDAGTTAYDSSCRENNGTLQGNPQWVDGRINSALSFNGSNDYVDCGSNDSLKVSAITMEAWVYSPTANFSGPNEIAGAEGAYGYNITDNKIWIHINTLDQGWHWCQTSDVLTWDGWHHVAFTYDGVNTVKCYRDGVLILTDTTSSSGKLQWADWTTNLYIGQINIGGERRLFDGMIDEVKIYNRPLQAEELSVDDVGYWKFDEGVGTTAYDSSCRGNNGTLQVNPQWVDGWINGALSFNGSSDYVDCGSNDSLKVSAITMEAWVYSPTANFSGPNEIAGAEGAYGYEIEDNKIWIHINTLDQGWHWCQTSDALTWDGWHHVAFTYDGVNTVKCYRDGVLILTDTTSSSGKLQWADWTTKLYIGQINTGSRLFNGVIDEVKIYNRPLTADQIWNDWQGP